jgi:F-type H+-transporting ATPase subunit d
MSVSSKIDWSKIASKLKPETMGSVNAFRSRHAAVLKTVTDLKEQEGAINFQNYTSLKNQQVVNEAKKALDGFKPAQFDLSKQLDIIEKARVEDVIITN